MARILVSYYKVQETPIKEMLCFWDGFVHDLRNLGNDVFVINTAYFNPYGSNMLENHELDYLLLEKAVAFDPELIITFNHRIPYSYLEKFSDVPIIIWDGDELTFFCDLPYIEAHKSRYTIFSISEGWLDDYRDFGFKENQIHYVPQATAIRSQDIEQTMNVSFLGIRHFHNQRYFSIVKSHKYGDRFNEIVKEFLHTGNYDYEALFRKYFNEDHPEFVMSLRDLYPLFDYRWLSLANMLDLGLTICGHESRWEDAAEFMPQLVAAYNPTRVWTLEENNWFYNSSKISICPLTAQARGAAFSWRVFDIMASNACLLISQTSDLKKMTEGYVKLPMYQTPWEAREYAQRLLADDELRLEIVRGSQRYVDENARWIHRFKDMEQIVGIKVVNESANPEDYSIYDVILDDPEIQEYIEEIGEKALFKNVSTTRPQLLVIEEEELLERESDGQEYEIVSKSVDDDSGKDITGGLSDNAAQVPSDNQMEHLEDSRTGDDEANITAKSTEPSTDETEYDQIDLDKKQQMYLVAIPAPELSSDDVKEQTEMVSTSDSIAKRLRRWRRPRFIKNIVKIALAELVLGMALCLTAPLQSPATFAGNVITALGIAGLAAACILLISNLVVRVIRKRTKKLSQV